MVEVEGLEPDGLDCESLVHLLLSFGAMGKLLNLLLPPLPSL